MQPSLDIDAEVPLKQIDMPLYDALRTLEPCGNAHTAPMLCARRLRVMDARRVGKGESHLKLKLSDGVAEKDGIAFRMGDVANDLPPYVDVAYQLEINEWNGSRRLELHVQDIRPAQ